MNNKSKSYLFRKFLFPTLLMFFATSASFAQEQVTGVVIDETGEGMPGVSVLVKGTQSGVVTDVNGGFTIKPEQRNAILSFSFLGYVTKEEKATPGKLMRVQLLEDKKLLDEVVVVGYQEVRKRDLTGSVAKADVSALTSTPIASFDQTLGGRLAGVNVSSNEGQPD